VLTGSGSKFVAKGSAAEVTVQPILAFETVESSFRLCR